MADTTDMAEVGGASDMTGVTGVRQQVLQLWLQAASLDTPVAAWAFHDGTEGRGPRPEGNPPYRTGVEALHDGWMLIQAPGALPVDHAATELRCEFVFERRITLD